MCIPEYQHLTKDHKNFPGTNNVKLKFETLNIIFEPRFLLIISYLVIPKIIAVPWIE